MSWHCRRTATNGTVWCLPVNGDRISRTETRLDNLLSMLSLTSSCCDVDEARNIIWETLQNTKSSSVAAAASHLLQQHTDARKLHNLLKVFKVSFRQFSKDCFSQFPNIYGFLITCKKFIRVPYIKGRFEA